MAANPSNTVTVHRIFAAPPEKLYKAFTDADAKARWLPPNGFTCKVHEHQAKVGVPYRMSFTNFTTGNSHGWTGKYVELKPGELIRYNDKFDDPNMPGEMEITVTLKKVIPGTEVHITQANIPPQIPVEFCYLGWQESLTYLKNLVEPNIPDN